MRSSTIVNELRVKTSEYVPLFCLPLPNKHNPVIVVPLGNSIISSCIQLKSPDYGLEVVGVIDETLIKLLFNFYEFLRNELDVNYGIRVRVNSSYVHGGFLYVFITNNIIKSLSGILSTNEIESLIIIDGRLGLNECVSSLRAFELVNGPYIWRYRNEVVKIDKDVGLHISKIQSTYKLNLSAIIYDEGLLNTLTHLVGLLTIKIFDVFERNKISNLRTYIKLYNALLMGMIEDEEQLSSLGAPPDNGIFTYIVDLDRVLGIHGYLKT